MKRNLYVCNYKAQEELSEIDFDLYESLFPRWSENDEEHPEQIPEQITTFLNDEPLYWIGESHPINIDDVIKVLNDMKEKGCNYVEIMYHTDHIGYVFTGLDVHIASEKEIAKHEEVSKNKHNAEIQRRIAQLEAEIQRLKK